MAKRKEKPLTREDVLKEIEKNGGTAKGLDLSWKVFEEGIDLSKLDLQGIILNGAELLHANLERANLEGANLRVAQLQGAILFDANLQNAELLFAKLQGTFLSGAKLQDAWLLGVELSSDTRLGGINWGNYILGEEKSSAFPAAAITYRRLKMWHADAGVHDIAAKFYYREKEANRKSLKLCSKKNWNNRLAAEFMRAFFGYGEEWKRIFGWIAVVIFGLAGAYYLWGSFSSSSFQDTLYYSAASFTALGYGNWAPQPTGWAKGMGAAEAVVGVFMMALLLVTFVRKWTR